MTRTVFALVLIGMAACVSAKDAATLGCGADGMQGLVGQNRDVLAAMSLPVGTRVIEPRMAITEDYRPERLNLVVDENGQITRVWCG
jgi:Peptidase inhibitor I78 family